MSCDMHPKYRRSPIRALTSIFAVIVASAVAAPLTASESASDAALKAILQKRLLVPDAKNIQLGATTPGPFSGMYSRTVTIVNPTAPGQKAEIEVFSDASGKKILLVQHY